MFDPTPPFTLNPLLLSNDPSLAIIDGDGLSGPGVAGSCAPRMVTRVEASKGTKEARKSIIEGYLHDGARVVEYCAHRGGSYHRVLDSGQMVTTRVGVCACEARRIRVWDGVLCL